MAGKIFCVTDFGAKTDGTLCTKAIQEAIDQCFLNGGGEVTVPEGRFLTGGLRLRSDVTLHLSENAVLLGSTDPEDYFGYMHDESEPISEEERSAKAPTALPESDCVSVYPFSRWNNAIIRAYRAKNIAVIGEKGSEINGQNCFDPEGEEHYRGPHAMNMWYCENITLRGYTVRDSANWAHAIQNSKNITVQNITVLAGHDGFDVRTCDHISIEDCKFQTGDDCIAGFDNINITVRNCYFESSCSIFRFGGTDMLVENCIGIAPATYGFRGHLSEKEKQNRADTTEKCRHSCHNVFLYYCDQRAAIRKTPGSILIRNSRFKNPDSVMRLPFGHIWCCNRSLESIAFENCVIEGVSIPVRLNCPPNEPLTLCMKDCTVTPRKGFEDIPFLEGENIKRITLTRVTVKGFANPKILCDPQTELLITK